MATPVSIDEIEEFTPSVLRNVPAPPVFLLRPASGREYRDFEHLLRKRALTFYSADDIRAETIKALKELWSAEAYEANKARLESYWALVDQGGIPDPADVEAVNELNGRLVKAWPRLAEMIADTMRFNDECWRIAASMFLVGWTGVPVDYSREAGVVPIEKIDAVEAVLADMEKKARDERVEGVLQPGMAFAQLTAAAYSRFHLAKDEEKNSSSPPSSAPTRNGSTRPSSKRTGGRKSRASASSGSTTA